MKEEGRGSLFWWKKKILFPQSLEIVGKGGSASFPVYRIRRHNGLSPTSTSKMVSGNHNEFLTGCYLTVSKWLRNLKNYTVTLRKLRFEKSYS